MSRVQDVETKDAEHEVQLTRNQCILLLKAYDYWEKKFYAIHISKRKTLVIYTNVMDFHHRTVDALVAKGHIVKDWGKGYRLTSYGRMYMFEHYESVAYQAVSTRGTESWGGQPEKCYTWEQIIELMNAGEFALACK